MGSIVLLENMWGDYLQKGDILEKPGLLSVDAHTAIENFGMYVSADIATSFTVLVGIFFPSATGMTIHEEFKTIITASTQLQSSILNSEEKIQLFLWATVNTG